MDRTTPQLIDEGLGLVDGLDELRNEIEAELATTRGLNDPEATQIDMQIRIKLHRLLRAIDRIAARRSEEPEAESAKPVEPAKERWTTEWDVKERVARKQWKCSGDGRATPNHAPGCSGSIVPGERHVEYVGESHSYQTGSKHSLACAIHFGYVDPPAAVPEGKPDGEEVPVLSEGELHEREVVGGARLSIDGSDGHLFLRTIAGDQQTIASLSPDDIECWPASSSPSGSRTASGRRFGRLARPCTTCA